MQISDETLDHAPNAVAPFWKLPREIWCRIWDEAMKQHGDYFAHSEKNAEALQVLRVKVVAMEKQLTRNGCMVMSKRRNIKSLEAEKSRLDTLFCEANYAIWRELSTEGTKTPNWAMRKKKREIELRKLIEREEHRVDDLFEEAAKMSLDLDAAETHARFVLTWTLSRLSKHV